SAWVILARQNFILEAPPTDTPWTDIWPDSVVRPVVNPSPSSTQIVITPTKTIDQINDLLTFTIRNLYDDYLNYSIDIDRTFAIGPSNALVAANPQTIAACEKIIEHNLRKGTLIFNHDSTPPDAKGNITFQALAEGPINYGCVIVITPKWEIESYAPMPNTALPQFELRVQGLGHGSEFEYKYSPDFLAPDYGFYPSAIGPITFQQNAPVSHLETDQVRALDSGLDVDHQRFQFILHPQGRDQTDVVWQWS
ncbi:MAG: hypothetical protein HQK53_20415, partial [Oligoflexia bacterium]|nr:hypothetical protein [Oligoflexia bacterium]